MSFRVLVVEDEADIADFVVRGLREEGLVVETAGNSVDAWAHLNATSWDVVVLDWRLPNEDGLSLLKRYRAIGGKAAVLLLTARDAVADRVQGLDGGADDYLCKPFAFAELLARVRALCRRFEPRGDNVLRYADLEIDLATRRVERAGARISLTAREELLLVYFARFPNQVLGKTRIYEAVWEDSYDGLSNTLEVHVMELRRKLEAVGPRLIFTLRGKGYLFGDNPAGGD